MAYKKTGRRRYTKKAMARGPKKGTFLGTLYRGASTATKALAVAKTAAMTAYKLKGIINSERKKTDFTPASSNLDVNGVMHINCVALGQGDTISQRTGNSILSKFVSVRGAVFLPSTLDSAITYVALVQDNQQISDSAPTFLDVFNVNQGRPLLNKDTVGRYTLLWSKTINLSRNSYPVIPLDIDVPLNHHVRYNGTAASDVQKGGIYLMACSDLGSGAVAKPAINAWARLTYYDN